MPSAARPNQIRFATHRAGAGLRSCFERFEIGAPLRADPWLWVPPPR